MKAKKSSPVTINSELESEISNFIKSLEMMDHPNYWYTYINPDHKIGFVSKAFQEFTGYKTSDFLNGKIDWKDIVHPDNFKITTKIFTDTFNGLSANNQKVIFKTQDGNEIHGSICAAPIFTSKKQFLGIYLIIENITESVLFQKNLKKLVKRYELITEFATDMIWTTDLNHKITYASPRTEEKYKINLKDGKEHFLYDVLLSEDIEKSKQAFHNRVKMEKAGIKTSSEFFSGKNLIANGESFWTETLSSPLRDEKGEMIGIVGVTRDVSDRIQVQNELEKTQKELISLNAQKDKFFSIMAHDLRGPVGNIKNLVELLSMNDSSGDTEMRSKIMDHLSGISQNTFKLLEDLLLWSRIQLNRIEVTREYFLLNEVIDENQNFFQENFQRKELILVNNVSKSQFIYADRFSIQTILRNLLSNSIKFSKRGGEIVLSSEEIEKDGTKSIHINVQDFGIGIPKNKINTLFEIDQQYSIKGTENEMGTGLGLILCKELIVKNEGDIWVSSDKGKGAKFTFCLKFPEL